MQNANYKQIEESYQKGGSGVAMVGQNQMALFPTQQETWNKLQNKGRDG